MTSFNSFIKSNPIQKLYFIKLDNLLIGFLKISKKEIYIWDNNGKINKENPLCLLDFYINENYQRNGYGNKLFSYMLNVFFYIIIILIE